jgi:hypothetical protein
MLIVAFVGVILIGISGHQIAGHHWRLAQVGVRYDLPRPVTAVVTELPTLLTILVGFTGLLLSSWQTIAELSQSPITVRQSIVGSNFIVVVVFVFVVLGEELISTLPLNHLGIVSVGGVLLVAAVGYLQLPRLWVLGRNPRPPTTDERKQLDRITQQIGIQFDDVVISEVDTFNGAVWIVGRFGTTRLILVESFLDSASNDDISIALAEANDRFHRNVVEYVGLAVLLLVIYIVMVGTGTATKNADTVTINLLSVATVTISIGLLYWKNKQSYYIDESLAHRFGASSLIDTYRRHGETLFVNGWGPRWLELLQPMPSAESRIERLQARFEVE